jgi:Hint module
LFSPQALPVSNQPGTTVSAVTVTPGRRLLAGVNVAYTVTIGTPSPVPMPTMSPACFAATERVTLDDGATKAISDVAVGDRILTVNAHTGAQVYSDVAYLPHGKNTDKAVFTVLATEAGRDVKMTANHMLPAGACDAAGSLPVVAASTVSAGDCVQTVSGRERVVSVGTVAGEGIYTVIAMEELLVVNGIVATPYGGVNPALANVYYNLHRLMYSVAGKALLAVQGATEGVWAALALLAASR